MSAPMPTADIGCDFVKISASGPMPTSRYCDHACLRDQHVLQPRRLGRARPHAREVVADDRDDRLAAPPSAFAGSPRACSSITRSSMLDDERDAGSPCAPCKSRRREEARRSRAAVRCINGRDSRARRGGV